MISRGCRQTQRHVKCSDVACRSCAVSPQCSGLKECLPCSPGLRRKTTHALLTRTLQHRDSGQPARHSHTSSDCTLAGQIMREIEPVTSLHFWSAGDGSCFPLHYDSDETVDNRRITAILYLNPDWQQGDGGELKLYPWPHEPVTVEPLHNRLLLFSTCRMLHRSTPSLAHVPVSMWSRTS